MKLSRSVVSNSMWPHGVALQAPLSMGFSRQEFWGGLPFPSPGDLPNPRIEPKSPTLQADCLPSEPRGKPGHYHSAACSPPRSRTRLPTLFMQVRNLLGECFVTSTWLSHLSFLFIVSLITFTALLYFLLLIKWVLPSACVNFKFMVLWFRRQSWSSTTQCRRRATRVWEADGPLMMYQWSPCELWC